MLDPIFDEVKSRLGDSIIILGPKRRDETVRVSSIRWDPTGARVTFAPTANGNIGERVWAVDIEIWAKDLTATTALNDQFRAVLHDIGSHFTFPPDGLETWKTGGVTPHGMICSFQLAIRTPIERTPVAAIVITDPEKIVTTGVIVTPTPPPDPLDPL
jgi:hypothetical protein